MIEQALFNPNEAAKYLGVSRSYFDDHVRPFLTVIDMKAPGQKQPIWRFARTDIDAFIQARRREKRPA